MKKIWRRSALILCGAGLLCGLAACGGNAGNSSAAGSGQSRQEADVQGDRGAADSAGNAGGQGAVDGAANVQAIAAGNENDALWTLNADGTVTAYRVNEPIDSSGYRKTVLEMTAMAVSVPEPIAELIPFAGQPLLRTAAGECYQCRPDDPLQTEKCAWNGVFQARSCGREVLFYDADGVLCSYFSDNPDGFSRDALCVVGWPGIVLAD